MRIYTRRGDDGTTSIRQGGRVRKDSSLIELNGTIDEAQAAIGLARSHLETGSELAPLLIELEHELWMVMAEVARGTDRENEGGGGRSGSQLSRSSVRSDEGKVSQDMIVSLERMIDRATEHFIMPKEFVLPGETDVSAALDFARTVVRRAERWAVRARDEGLLPGESLVGAYLNRLSDLLWSLARWEQHDSSAAE
ncbi:MAG: cob(I)yrinic acid a,c-diamide adenosyltransferase [Actinobacteria bacterium]|nr:cob(I)yrinic acid a,c-diamide adenosyltransferase [Actinomycetota bacterium]MCL6095409.1 cob(I)yrinic acid a,c-diamide adenosyltransferase [Actinomycetota bacterium]